ncbi:universal stress protein [Chloroflexota bacterium]
MYQKILVPLDGSELAECVLPHVEAITKGCGVKEVTFLRVVEPFYIPAVGDGGFISPRQIKQFEDENRKSAETYLSRIESQAKYEAANVRTEVLDGQAAKTIAEYATKNEFDLIIIATHGRSGISRWVWGSVADRTLRSACVPVLMVRAPGCVPGI